VSTPATSVTLLTANTTTTLTAVCPADKSVIGGGYESSAVSFVLHPVAMFPVPATPLQPDAWRVTLRLSGTNSAVTFTFRVYAICVAS
jgi:hypothetical protein